MEKFAAQGVENSSEMMREIMLLIEGCQSLALNHNNLDYIDAASHAALVLVKNYQAKQ